jgi:hypothetical protein
VTAANPPRPPAATRASTPCRTTTTAAAAVATVSKARSAGTVPVCARSRDRPSAQTRARTFSGKRCEPRLLRSRVRCVGGSCQPPCDEPCHGWLNNVCVPLCNTGEVCGPDGQCQLNCPAGYTPCGGQCVPRTPRGDGVCCEWQGNWHACAAGEQCAAYGCCSAGAEVCLGNGTAQCCYGGLVCQAGRCCYPDGVAGFPVVMGTACCSYQ